MKMVSDDQFLYLISEKQNLELYLKRLKKEYFSFRKCGFFNLINFRDPSLVVKVNKIKRMHFFSKTVAFVLSLYLFVFLVSKSISDIEIIFASISALLSFIFLIISYIYKEKYKDLLCTEIDVVSSYIDRVKQKIVCLDDMVV